MISKLGDRRPVIEGDGHFVAANATVIGDVTLKPRSSVWFQTVIRGDVDSIVIGEGSNVQDASVLHTDEGFPLVIGKDVTVGHKVMLHGCRVGDNSLIGIASTVLNGAHIGRNSIVGANALVTEGKIFPDGVLILGAPAKIVRELTEDEIAAITMSAAHYVKNAERFSREFGPGTA